MRAWPSIAVLLTSIVTALALALGTALEERNSMRVELLRTRELLVQQSHLAFDLTEGADSAARCWELVAECCR